MIIAQCDTLISLVDDRYYGRAWCSVEALVIKTLRKSYKHYLWYEHVLANSDDVADGRMAEKPRWILREGPIDFRVDMEQKDLTFELDRPRVNFLQRQCHTLE